jgi:membrane protease YdiL (CAAX protease family)
MSKDSSDPGLELERPSKARIGWDKWKNRGSLKRHFGSPIRVVLTTLVIFFLSQFIAAFFVELALGLSHGTNFGNSIDQSAATQFFFVLIAEGLAILLTFNLLKVRGIPFRAIGLGRRPKLNDLTKGAVGFVIFYLVLIIITAILTAIVPNLDKNQTQDVGFNTLNTALDSVLAFVALVILPPLGEETLVRGYLYSGLRSRWRFIPALLLTSVLFGAAHLQSGAGGSLLWSASLDTFVLSSILVYLRETTGALYAGMLVHGLNNLIAFGVHFHSTIF